MALSLAVNPLQRRTFAHCTGTELQQPREITREMKVAENQEVWVQSGAAVRQRTHYLVLRAHADSPQQPPLLFAQDAVNLAHRWEVKLIWWPIKVEAASLVIIHVAANHCAARQGATGRCTLLAADLSAALGFPSARRTSFLWIFLLRRSRASSECGIFLTKALRLGSSELSESVIIIQNRSNCGLIE